ncbi:MAG: alanine racemase [Verrucomicrobia bacterium]|nr:alanine racemase [Verrucomicrobiota bacterium]
MGELSHESEFEMPHRSWAEIDLSAIRHNARIAQSMCGGTSPAVLAIVKADAYGHGAVDVSRALEQEPCVFAFGVANVREALELRSAGISLPIYVLGAALPAEREILVSRGFIAAISNLEEAEHFSKLAVAKGTVTSVQIVIDTGMGRMGVLPDRALTLALTAASLPGIRIDSISSHLPSADEDSAFTKTQIENYRAILSQLRNAGIAFPRSHIANSAGTMGYSVPSEECVRAGLMLYGTAPIPLFQDRLKPALTWKARVVLVRDLPAGHGINYGRTFITRRPTVAATISAGYADGYPRHLSGKGAEVLINGQRCPVLGRITMDQIVADVTDLKQRPAAGAEVVMLGRQGDTLLSAVELAEMADTIPWEIYTGIGSRVTRIAR